VGSAEVAIAAMKAMSASPTAFCMGSVLDGSDGINLAKGFALDIPAAPGR